MGDTDITREFVCLIEACFIHGIHARYMKKKSSKYEINLWGVFESFISKADQQQLKADNRLLKTKTGLARAAIRHFLNGQILDCYFQALLLDATTINKYYEPHALLRDPDQAEVVKDS